MKKLFPFFIVVGMFFMLGCGPKGASNEVLSRLEQAKLAAESSETKAKSLEAQRIRLEQEKDEKQARIASLENELSVLKEAAKVKPAKVKPKKK